MVDEPRYAEIGRQLITEFNAFPEQGGRAELFAVRRSAVPEAVLQSAPETAIGEDTDTPPEQVLEQRDPPGEAEITVVGFARSAERTAEMGPRRPDHAKEFRRGEQHFEIDVGPRFDGLVEQSDVMGEDTKLEFVDELGLRCRCSRDSGDQHSGNNHGAKHPHHYRYSRSAFTAHLISRNQLIDFSPDANPALDRAANGLSAFQRADQQWRLSSRRTTPGFVTQLSCTIRRSPTCGRCP